MKATGIVRRIDDLGRVVIPKEIRRTMRIREGDPLEIYTSADGEVIFKKYSPIGELFNFAMQYVDSLSKFTKLPIIVTDRDHCIAAAGISKKEVIERRITPTLEDIMEQRKGVVFEDAESPQALEGIERMITAIVPIINAGDVNGAIVLLSDDNGTKATDADFKMLNVAADFLGSQID